MPCASPSDDDLDVPRLRARLQAAEQRAAKLAQAAAALRGTLESLRTADDLQALLGHTLKSIADQIGVQSASAWIFDRDLVAHLVWTIQDGRVVRGPESTHANANKPSAPSQWHYDWLRGMGTPKPNVVAVSDHPGLTDEQRAFLAGRGIKALISVPVVLANQLVGSFTLHLRSETYPLDEDLELIQALANQVSLAFHVTRLSDEVRAAAVEAARAAAVSGERNRLARDIHDTIAQGLAAIVRQLEAARAAPTPEASAKNVSVAAEIARESLVEARRSIRALRPPALEGHSLEEALRSLVGGLARICSAELTLSCSGARRSLPAAVEDELYHVVHEALTNAIKHARARRIAVDLAYDESGLSVGVRDDGAGFDPATVSGGVGSSSMRERAQRIGAVVTVASEPGTGTEVLVYWAG